jgi:hypothetical protein
MLARVTDWTVILTGVGTASVTGWFGYLAIRRSTDVTKKQIEEETARAREQTEAENERLRTQHREDHLRNRQATYHALLAADQELVGALGQDMGDAPAAFATFRHLGNGAVLFGIESVKDTITAVLAQYVYVFREARERAGDRPATPADVRAVFDERIGQVNAARTALVEAMRDDVGPS